MNGVFVLNHTTTGNCLMVSTDYKAICSNLTSQQARSGEYHIEVRDYRGHLCNAVYSLKRKAWVLQKIS